MRRYLIILIIFCWSLRIQAQRNYHTIDFKHPEVGQLIVVPIYFDLDFANLRADSRKFLDSIAGLLTKIDTMTFVLEYHTDCRSSYQYNIDLSQRRADSAVAYLKQKNNNLQIKSVGMGEGILLNDCDCEGKSKQLYTRYFEDTINGVIYPTRVNMFDCFSCQNDYRFLTPDEKEAFKYLKFIPCTELNHLINRRTILRISGRYRNGR